MATYAANLSDINDELVERLKASDEQAFGTLFAEFRERIYRTAFRILKEEESAKDALQETLVNVHRGAPNFRGEARLSTWINRITINVCLEMIRKNKKHSARLDEDISDHAATFEDVRLETPFQYTSRKETSSRLHSALNRLTDKHSIVVRMHDIEGYTIKEISEILGVAEGTIKSRLFYGREELKRQLVH